MGIHQDQRRCGAAGSCACVLLALVCAAGLSSHGSARADDELAPELLDDPFDYTQVADGFDGRGLFDLDVSVGFERLTQRDTIEREAAAQTASAGGSRRVTLADSEIATTTLSLGVELGVFRNLMVYGRIPLVLSEERTLELAGSARCGVAPCDEQDALLRDVPKDDVLVASHRLLVLDPVFTSATRSGVPHVDLGVAWGVLPLRSAPHGPVWVLLVEGRVPVGEVMKPCAADSGCDTGISRGTSRLELETRFSYRVRYFEPYLGLSHSIEWATSAADRFEPADVPEGVDATPPSVTEATVGAVFVPWRQRGRHQRFGLDLRGTAAFVSPGRDYTPLFDGLGTSDSPMLSGFTGLAQVGAHVKLGVEAGAIMQAAQYVQFRLGLGAAYRTPHLLTGAGACTDGTAACAKGPLHFPVIDRPGQRFRSAGQWDVGLSALAIGQF